jgi:Chalcone isomerase-like
MNRRFFWLLAALLLPSAALAQGARQGVLDVSGVKYPPTAQLGGATLQLNGAGLRSRFLIKVYTAGLYIGSRAATPEAVLAATGPRRMHVVMLREIDANELGKLFTRGMQDNAPKGEFSKFIPGTLRLADIFSSYKRLKAGDVFFVDYVPGVGTTVVVNGKDAGEPIAEPEFFNALMRIWLGDKPADEGLKSALLGKPASNVGGSPGQQ